MKKVLILTFILALPLLAFAQKGTIKGRVFNE